MKYIHYFGSEAAYNQARNNNYIEPWVSYTEGRGLDYNKPYDPYLHMPFTIEALGSGNITWALDTKTVQYSKNGSSWETMTKNTTISVVEGDEVQFKGNNSSYSYFDFDRFKYIGNSLVSTVDCNVYGNIMSLTDGDNFENADTVNGYAFYSLFFVSQSDNFRVVNAKNLKLPATTLATSCYEGMFSGCTSLTAAPELPVTTLAESCYSSMFSGCTSLTTAPVLPATTLANSCYSLMFGGCTSLTTAPELPAATLAVFCYAGMFSNCTNLTTAPELPVTALTESCYAGMFQGCTSLTTAPVLPATTLTGSCYNNMFQGCTNLNYIKAMFTTAPSSTYTSNWVSGVASTGTFVKNASATWTTTGVHGIPTGWTVQTATE